MSSAGCWGHWCERHTLVEGAEVTLEANPEDFDLGRARQLVDLGFNRVSFGAQSFDGSVLSALGRRHGPEDIESSVDAARNAVFHSVSVDLIFGTPEETAASWRETLDRAVAAGPDHVSCYALTVEPGTPLNRAVLAGAPAPDPDVQADRYEAAESRLGRSRLSAV